MIEVFLVFLRLGLTCFGGPVAHLGYFHDEFVQKRRWLSDPAYADLVALCQFLPGPASSQVGMAIGISRAGIPGAVVAWLGFTLPSALVLIFFALGLSYLQTPLAVSMLHGLKIVAVAVVAQALWVMGQKLCPDRRRATMAFLAAVVMILVPTAWAQILVLLVGGVFACFFFKTSTEQASAHFEMKITKRAGFISLGMFFIFLFGGTLFAQIFTSDPLRILAGFYRAGSLVFGGGHVVLPLLQAALVPPGWISNDVFLAGYGAAQGIPGPLFSFAAFLGAATPVFALHWLGGMLCLLAIFLPSFFLVVGILPFWQNLRRYPKIQVALQGINAVVVGLLLAAFYNPVFTSAMNGPRDIGLALLCFLLLVFWKTPSWLVVLVGALVGSLL